ncbi:MAG: Heat shock protein, Metallo peptidase, family [candidate division NC10 bacterium]|nr:Heat shock protein, Metallo peptidase, family [candidate division NC10 bacterium]
MNTMKTFLLMGVLTVMLVFIGRLLGGEGGMIMAFVLAAVMNFGTYWFSDKLVLRMYNAQQVTQADAPELYNLVQELSGRANLPMPKVYVIPGDQPNAFATGRNPQNAAVAVTQGIMRTLSRDELRGVIGHELAHVKHRDILVGTVAATMAGAISMIANMAQWAMIFGGGRSSDDEGGNPIAGLAMMIVAPIAAMMVQMAISRSREFLADEGGAQIAGNPLSLSSALRKLDAKAHEIPMHASPATAHMFIVSPLTGGGLMKLFSTHPPMEERIARLEAMVYGAAAVR